MTSLDAGLGPRAGGEFIYHPYSRQEEQCQHDGRGQVLPHAEPIIVLIITQRSIHNWGRRLAGARLGPEWNDTCAAMPCTSLCLG